MDVIYHRNCLDGVFSGYLFYLITKVIDDDTINNFISHFADKIKQKSNFQSTYSNQQYEQIVDLTKQVIGSESKIQICSKDCINKHQIKQDFFHQPNQGVSYSAYSIYAGQFIPLKFPTKNKVLLVLDTSLVSYENLIKIGQKYELVILIDHHTSFQPIKKDILLDGNKMKKLFYLFSENYCATELCLQFLQKYFNFDQFFQEKYIQNLKKMVGFVGANDRKHMQTKQSKSFVLGFYYFDIQLSHMNPLLNKRLGMLNLDYLMEKGINLYKGHLKQIAQEVSQAVVCQIQMSGQLKGNKFYLLKPRNPSKISDIGIVLSFLSKKHQMQNLALLYMQKSDQIRISARSHKCLENPLALQLSQKFQGGGHVHAAGFKISMNRFKSLFTKTAIQKNKLNLSPEQVQNILFFKDNILK